jgi:hypothetical protein
LPDGAMGGVTCSIVTGISPRALAVFRSHTHYSLLHCQGFQTRKTVSLFSRIKRILTQMEGKGCSRQKLDITKGDQHLDAQILHKLGLGFQIPANSAAAKGAATVPAVTPAPNVRRPMPPPSPFRNEFSSHSVDLENRDRVSEAQIVSNCTMLDYTNCPA